MSTVSENHISTKFFECCSDSYFYQHVLEPTRERIANEPSTLDLIFTNEENMLSNLQYLPGVGKSILLFDLNCYIEKEVVSFKKFNFFKGDYKAVDEGLLSVDWDQVLGKPDLSDSWDFLADKIILLIELYLPENKVSGQSDRENPFIKQACIEAIRAKILSGNNTCTVSPTLTTTIIKLQEIESLLSCEMLSIISNKT